MSATPDEAPATSADAADLQQLRATALLDFAQNTTAHGVSRLAHGSRVQRLLWCLLIVGACAGFSTHLSELVQRYLSYPVSTEFRTGGAAFQFPTVTICPTNFIVSGGYPRPVTSVYANPALHRIVSHMIYDVARLIHHIQQPDWSVHMPYRAYNSYEDGKLALKALAYRTAQFQAPYETVIYCRYNSELCSYRNFTIYKDDENFQCLSFHPDNASLARAGKGNGLNLVLANWASAFLTNDDEIEHVPGFQVALHDYGTKPDFDYSFSAPYSTKTSAQIDSQLDEKINRDANPCAGSLPNVTYVVDYSRPGDLETKAFVGTQRDCVVRLMQQEFLTACGCLATHLPMPADMFNDSVPCHNMPEEVFFRDIFYLTNSSGFTHYTITQANNTSLHTPLSGFLMTNWNEFKTTRDFISCFHTVRYRQNTEGMDTSRCWPKCSNSQFSVVAQSVPWPKDLALVAGALHDYATDTRDQLRDQQNVTSARLDDFIATTSNYIKNGYVAHLDLFARSTRVTVSSEAWSYPLRNLFSDFGGILGLWIGVSIITLLEVMELIMQLSGIAWMAMRQSTTAVAPVKKVLTAAAPGIRNIFSVSGRDGVTKVTDEAAATALDIDPASSGLQLDVSLPGKRPAAVTVGDSSHGPTALSASAAANGGGITSVVRHSKSWFQRFFSI